MKFLHVNGVINPDLIIYCPDGTNMYIAHMVTRTPIEAIPFSFATREQNEFISEDGTRYSWEENTEKTITIKGTKYRAGPSGYAMYLNGKNQWRLSARTTNSDLENYRE